MPSHRLPDGSIPVLLTADSVIGMRAEAAAIRGYLDTRPQITPEQVSDMVFRTRIPRRYRALALVRTRDELLGALRAVVDGTEHPAVVSGSGATRARRIGFVFPGQGSQRPGMGAVFYDRSTHYRQAVDECAALHLDRFGHSEPLSYLRGDEGGYADAVWVIQPALMFHMYGLAAMWQAAGVRPAATIGHSQGELAAGAVAGVMTPRDSVLAVTLRALAVDRHSPDGYSMAVLGMNRDETEALLARHTGWAELSVVNSPNILAVSGERKAIATLVAAATEAGKFAREIKVDYPAHTSIVSEFAVEAAAMLGDEMSGSHFTSSDIACYGATLGTPITPEMNHQNYWFLNLRNRVRFDLAITAAAAGGIDTFIEVAEHPILQLALQENLSVVPPGPGGKARDFTVLGTSVRTAEGLGEFSRNVAAIAVHDTNFDWTALRVPAAEERPARPLLDFPLTWMNPEKLWAKASYGPDAFAETGGPNRPRPERLVQCWRRLDRQSLVAPRALAVLDHTGECTESAEALRVAADRHGANITVLDARRVSEPGTDLSGIDALIVLLPPRPAVDGPEVLADVADFFAERAWLPGVSGLSRGAECWLVTIGGEVVVEHDTVPQMFHGAVAAGFRSVGVEYPGLSFRHLDLAATESVSTQAARVIAAVHSVGEPELALRDGAVYTKRLVRDDILAPVDETRLDHVLIVGGTGQLGLLFCAHFVDAGARRITLLSRSGETDAVASRLARLRRRGYTEIVVHACDATDPAAVAAVAAGLADRPVTLLVHAAVNYIDAGIAEITREMVDTAAGSKIIGLHTVLAGLPLASDCRIVLFSSIAATVGGRGQPLYAVNNRMLDITAHALRERGYDCVSLEWGLWQVVGPLDADGLARVDGMGIVPMEPSEAIAAGLTGHRTDAVVAAGDWPHLHDMLSAFGHGPLVGELFDTPAAVSHTPTREPAAVPPSARDDHPEASAPTAAPVDGDLADLMLVELARVMGADGIEAIDSAAPLVALGLDSLQALDFRKRVKAELDRDLPVAAILGGASFDDIVLLMTENTNEG
ncbi:nocobactin polyketide synthase NbtC [Nocardia brevicatena]|uniref:nocobactin polyketide synthase NbtC n=1 Tax=Nocardia brevicatena TaxID=37327 RepID=UPI0002D765A5|nr:nocobactin polyketide synthase NbtC [Nocardia brevicatena]